eukprot:scaffold486_cov170-Chaetoceros_neogracile.AAC.3
MNKRSKAGSHLDPTTSGRKNTTSEKCLSQDELRLPVSQCIENNLMAYCAVTCYMLHGCILHFTNIVLLLLVDESTLNAV